MPLVVLAAVTLAGAELGYLTGGRLALASLPGFWPPAGALAAALILSHRRRWPALVPVACGAMLFSLTVVHGHGVLAGLALSAVSGLEACVIAWFVRRAAGDDAFALDRLTHTFALIVGAVVVPIGGGLLASTALSTASADPFPSVWLAWWLSATVGVIVTAPGVLAAMTIRRGAIAELTPWKALEMAVALIAGTLVAAAIFGGRLDPVVRVPAYTLPFLLWPVFRFGPGVASAAAFILTFIALWNAARGQLPLALLGEANLLLRTQGGITVVMASLLLLASVVAERRRVADERNRLVAELQQALAEIKTLRGFIPMCAWCHKVRDDAGFWLELEKYLDTATDATVSHSICPACLERAAREIAAHEGIDAPAR